MFSFLSNYQRILITATMLLVLMWVVESFFLVKLYGNTKRGFRIWSKPLSNEMRAYLGDPTKNILVPHRISGNIIYSFIIKKRDEVIICPFNRTIFPCVAYVNLIKPNAKLEHRAGVSHFFALFLALAYSFYSFIPFFALILILNYWIEIRIIDNYLNRKIMRTR